MDRRTLYAAGPPAAAAFRDAPADRGGGSRSPARDCFHGFRRGRARGRLHCTGPRGNIDRRPRGDRQDPPAGDRAAGGCRLADPAPTGAAGATPGTDTRKTQTGRAAAPSGRKPRPRDGPRRGGSQQRVDRHVPGDARDTDGSIRVGADRPPGQHPGAAARRAGERPRSRPQAGRAAARDGAQLRAGGPSHDRHPRRVPCGSASRQCVLPRRRQPGVHRFRIRGHPAAPAAGGTGAPRTGRGRQ